ncbi:MAG: endonuclease [Blastopirellula sp.]|nr:MAG: endonuclease [Blastopirellula sp.]
MTSLKITLLMLLAALVGIASESNTSAAEPNDKITVRAMSFNIRYDNPRDGENAWPHRKHLVADVVIDFKADVVGMQEVVKHQAEYLAENLGEHGFKWFGVGRDDGKDKGEFAPIFYNAKKYTVLDRGYFWLSETPDVIGSKSWDAAITRIATWLKLQDKESKKEFFVFNTHFDHRGRQSRFKSAQLLSSKLVEIAGSTPAVLLGDFNCLPDSDPYRTITALPANVRVAPLRDAFTLAKTKKGPETTWSGFKEVTPNRRIDFIFVHGNQNVIHHEIIDRTVNGRFPSDHLPLVAELEF